MTKHNRMYEGRAMRVQLRDCNPSRGYWRHNRGRGRFQAHVSHSRPPVPDNSDKAQGKLHSPGAREHGGSPAIDEPRGSLNLVEDVFTGSEPPAYSEQNVPKSAKESNDVRVPQTRPSSPTSSLAPSNLPQPENYREWYDNFSPAMSPPPATALGPSTVFPYSMPAGYYGPPPWVHPYAPQLPYQMSYMGYTSYRPPSQPLPQAFPRQGPEVNAPTAPTPWPPVGYGVNILEFPYYPRTNPKALPVLHTLPATASSEDTTYGGSSATATSE